MAIATCKVVLLGHKTTCELFSVQVNSNIIGRILERVQSMCACILLDISSLLQDQHLSVYCW
jgi:hypothetical protein